MLQCTFVDLVFQFCVRCSLVEPDFVSEQMFTSIGLVCFFMVLSDVSYVFYMYLCFAVVLWFCVLFRLSWSSLVEQIYDFLHYMYFNCMY